MPHVMAQRIQELNKQYRVYYVERMSFGAQHYAYDDMLQEFPSFFEKRD